MDLLDVIPTRDLARIGLVDEFGEVQRPDDATTARIVAAILQEAITDHAFREAVILRLLPKPEVLV